MGKKISEETRAELVDALRERYQSGSRAQKTRILEEFVAVSGYHRKSAIRVLNGSLDLAEKPQVRRRPRLYDEAVAQALIVLWEASDRVCGKRLHALLPVLMPALERHGHLELDRHVRERLTTISAASIDRLLRQIRSAGGVPRAKRAPTAVSREVPVRTFADWAEPAPGYMEMDLVAHCGEVMGGNFIHTLSLTDVASGWTECVPLLVREGSLVVESVEALRSTLPFLLRGLDVDNGSEFLNEALVRHCAVRGIELTRSRPYHKNDQAWIEQKNGAVVRRLVGYRRLQGVAAADALMRLYAAARLFVNFFQPSFKLKEKERIGGRVVKRYHPPLTPYARLMACEHVCDDTKRRLQNAAEALDPLQLLEQIRRMQQQLALLADQEKAHAPAEQQEDLTGFLAGLSTAWQAGEVRPTHQRDPKPIRSWRTRTDPFEAVWPTVREWLAREPDQTGRCLFQRLQDEHPGVFPDNQLRTLQRRLKAWRREMAHRLVFGVSEAESPMPLTLAPGRQP